jgi:hypothetical protein
MRLLTPLMAAAMVASSAAFAPGFGFLPSLRTPGAAVSHRTAVAKTWGAPPIARGVPSLRVNMVDQSEVAMPALSSTMKEGKIVQWTKSVRLPNPNHRTWVVERCAFCHSLGLSSHYPCQYSCLMRETWEGDHAIFSGARWGATAQACEATACYAAPVRDSTWCGYR